MTKVSDEDFIRIWKETASPKRVSDITGVAVQNVHARRRRIEAKYNIRLPVYDPYRPDRSTMMIEANRAVIKLPIKNGTVLVGSDAHIWPGELTTMQRAFLKLAKKLKPTVVIANGDFCDFPQMSRWPSIGWENKPTVAKEVEAVQDYLTKLEKATPGASKLWVLGNHDMRFETLIAARAPEMAKVYGVHLKDHFPAWTPCWRVDINDDVIVRHRELGGEHADFRNVVTAGKTVVTGHDHRTGVTPYRNYTGMHWGVRLGYMADSPLDPQFLNYLEGKEPNWHPAFGVLTFQNGRLLWPELCTKHDDGVVQWRGELIEV